MKKGRRKRAKRKSQQTSHPLDHERTLINLKKFMSRNGFNDETHLKLRYFPNTGRGVTSSKALHENDILISVPCKLMITYATLSSGDFLQMFTPQSKLTIHDLLATFLIIERHKKDSIWIDYLNSLPLEPPWIPALLSEEHVKLLPVDVRLEVEKSRRLVEESWSRIKRSINDDWTCCCGKKASCVLKWHSFLWGYILVNTRAVYVNPKIIREISNCSDSLSDEPCMGLCPLLDMFNHSHKAKSQAELIWQDRNLIFRLITLSHYKKYDQIFISYGHHNNIKLLVEYGFFIPHNCYDSVVFQFEHVLKILKLSFSDVRYKFIKNHNLEECLFVNETGPSFSLKALLYVGFCDDGFVKSLTSTIYNESYPQDFLEVTLKVTCRKLLCSSLEYMENKLYKMMEFNLNSIIINFLKYRCEFIEYLIKQT